ncbi:glycosyltransferase family 2 protein [Sulfuricaulis sp.]|uniref:glycosyltransferase family 2 protein n=1 Tax=Sulfuricaulis sp. TaxID=2003553 RepID=UPI00355A6D0F
MVTLAVSVIIPTYNRASLVARAIESALAAIGPDDEILVVDDSSTDDTAVRLAAYGNNIRHIVIPHGGAGAARNRGVAEARNPLVAFLDSDDEWFADKLELQRNVMEAQPAIAFCFSDFVVRDRHERTFPRYLKNWHNDPRPWDQILGPGFRYSSIASLPPGRDDFLIYVGDLYLPLMARLYIGTFTLLFRKDIPGGPPAFPVDLPTYEDWQFFGELAKRGPGAYLDCETAIQHGHNMPRLTNVDVLIQAVTRIKLLERVWGTDTEFLARHGNAYREVIEDQRRRRKFYAAKKLLKAGRMREAKSAFADVTGYPIYYRVLLYFPGYVVRMLVWLVEKLRMLVRAGESG